jgi:hypothetical protein
LTVVADTTTPRRPPDLAAQYCELMTQDDHLEVFDAVDQNRRTAAAGRVGTQREEPRTTAPPTTRREAGIFSRSN